MKAKRQSNIELARIIGCLLVICVHFVIYTYKGQIQEKQLFIRCLVTDGVPIFWYIMGFFLFINPNVSCTNKMKKTVKELVLPAFCVMVFSQIWQDWIRADFGEVNFFDCLDMHSFDAYNLFGNILKWSAQMTFGGHFWYVFSYVQIIMWMPLLKFVCIDESKANKCRRYLMSLAALSIIVNDIKNVYVPTINGETYTIVPYTIITPVLLNVLLGYEASIHYNVIKKNARWLKWCGFTGYMVFQGIRYALTSYYVHIDASDVYFMGTNTVVGFATSGCLFLALLSLDIKSDSKVATVINGISSKTLGVYLIHVCMIGKLKAIGVRDIVFSLATKHPDSLAAELICTIMYAVVVFSACACIIMLFQLVKHICVSAQKKEKQNGC